MSSHDVYLYLLAPINTNVFYAGRVPCILGQYGRERRGHLPGSRAPRRGRRRQDNQVAEVSRAERRRTKSELHGAQLACHGRQVYRRGGTDQADHPGRVSIRRPGGNFRCFHPLLP